MNTLDAILQRLGGAYDRAFTNPNPQMSDEDIMNLYRGRINHWVTPEALRDAELGVQKYLKTGPLTLFLNDVRDRALKARGLHIDQGFEDILDKVSPSTGRIMRDIVNQPATGDYME